MTQEAENHRAKYRGHAEAFKDRSVVEAYRYRPPYPAETFDILTGLINGEPRRVLDVGCGRGDIARNLVERVERVDAVDFSQAMIEQGKRLPNGDHPHLRWLYGRIEEVPLEPPYALITAGRSLHWLDWRIVMPRFRAALSEGGYLAMVTDQTTPDAWSMLDDITRRYRTDTYSRLADDETRHLFHRVGEKITQPMQLVQSIDDYIESYHSRSGFSRERMGQERAAAFDQEARAFLQQSYSDGMITLQVRGHVVWGVPQWR